MANMAYCRFENTLIDLLDCKEHLNDTLTARSEHAARLELVQLCADIAAEYTDPRDTP